MKVLLSAVLAAMFSGCVVSDDTRSPRIDPDTQQSCSSVDAGPRILRLLSHKEYDATIRDLFGMDAHWGDSFVPHRVAGGFSNNAFVLTMNPLLADQMRRAAEAIASDVMANIAGIVPCSPEKADMTCVRQFVARLGKRVFRRPLTAQEVGDYMALFQSVADVDGNLVAFESVIATFLQSPHFLYRTELGDESYPARSGYVHLNDYEIASELSYLFWGTMPDEELFAAAGAGALHTEVQIQSQVVRLLRDPRSDAMLERFINEWLGIRHLDVESKDLVAYPRWTQKNRDDLRTEMRRFTQHVRYEGSGTLSELINAPYSFVNRTLAQYYGLPSMGIPLDQFVMVDISGIDRAGLLTNAAVMSVHGKPNASAPVHRGRLIREKLLCQTIAEPPPGVVTQLPPPSLMTTTRDRYSSHMSDPVCGSCHTLLDPIGFAFEHFDAIGAYRSEENGFGVDSSGSIADTDGDVTTFSGATELANILAQRPDVHACYARHWIRYGVGLSDTDDLACLSSKIADEFQLGPRGILDVLVMLTRTPHFVERIR